MLVILLVGAFGKETALRLGGLRTSGSRRLKLVFANHAVGFAGVKVNWCSDRSDGDCCQMELSGSKVPGTLCRGISGRGCSSSSSACSGLQG